ncbi:hypothetical protein ACKKBF_B01895 [Auxenochlorella protothecoides x Auxenochlorella symbiontica]
MQDSLRSHLRSLGTVLGQATKTATNAAMEVSRAVATEVGGARCLQDYALQAQVATGGPQGLWRIYTAQAKKSDAPFQVVSAWILDKRALTESDTGGGGRQGGLTRPSTKRLEAFLEQCRRDVQHLARLKHPLVLRLLSPLEETRTQMVFVTEAVVSSLADYLAACNGPPPPLSVSHPGTHASPSAVRMSELELKHGVLQMADAIHFLHSGASMAHRGICPHAVFIARAGGWKLAWFAFATPLDFRDGEASGGFDFSDRHPSMLAAALKPSLAYCAPELVASGSASAGGMLSACDAFSMAALTYELFAHRQLLPVGSDLVTYESHIRSLTQRDLDGVPMELWGPLRGMLAPIPSARTPVEAFTASAYFQGDTRLRALRFLGTLMQREPAQKAAFFKDLETMLGSLDGRVLRTLVLPPVLGELHNAALAPTLVPLVMRLMASQSPEEAAEVTLPALRPLARGATGATLGALVAAAPALQAALPRAAAAGLVPGLLARGMAPETPPATAETAARGAAALAPLALDFAGLKALVVPAARALCLSTTSAPVRVAAFEVLAGAAPRLDVGEAEATLAVAAQVTAVDRSAPSVAAAAALGAALARQHGPDLAARCVLPMLCPLLVAPSLSAAQRAALMRAVRELLAVVEGATDKNGSVASAAPHHTGSAQARPGPASAMPALGAADPADWLAATDTSPAAPGRREPQHPARASVPQPPQQERWEGSGGTLSSLGSLSLVPVASNPSPRQRGALPSAPHQPQQAYAARGQSSQPSPSHSDPFTVKPSGIATQSNGRPVDPFAALLSSRAASAGRENPAGVKPAQSGIQPPGPAQSLI